MHPDWSVFDLELREVWLRRRPCVPASHIFSFKHDLSSEADLFRLWASGVFLNQGCLLIQRTYRRGRAQPIIRNRKCVRNEPCMHCPERAASMTWEALRSGFGNASYQGFFAVGGCLVGSVMDHASESLQENAHSRYFWSKRQPSSRIQ